MGKCTVGQHTIFFRILKGHLSMLSSGFLCDLKTFILDLFYPPACRMCSALLPHEAVLCFECSASLKQIASRTFKITSSFSLTVIAAGEYEGVLRKLVLRKLYSDRRASIDLAYLMS